jgi:hypothetical protein
VREVDYTLKTLAANLLGETKQEVSLAQVSERAGKAGGALG